VAFTPPFAALWTRPASSIASLRRSASPGHRREPGARRNWDQGSAPTPRGEHETAQHLGRSRVGPRSERIRLVKMAARRDRDQGWRRASSSSARRSNSACPGAIRAGPSR
jgi:hypothetical protein